MANSLPAKYTTGLNGGYEVVYFIVMSLSAGKNRVIFSTSSKPVTTLTLEYQNIAINTAKDYYKPEWFGPTIIKTDGSEEEVIAIGEMDFQLDAQSGGGMAPVNECTLQFLNQGLFSDFLAQFDVENEEVEIWEGYIPLSGTIDIDLDCLLRFKGVISNSGAWDFERMVIPLIDRRHLDSKELPKKIITRDNYPGANDDVIGVASPIIVGNFWDGWDTWNENGCLLLPIDNFSIKFLACEHRTANAYVTPKVYAWDDDLKHGEILSTITRTINNTIATFILGRDGRARVNIYAEFNVVPKLPYSTNELEHDNAVDGDESTLVSVGNNKILSVSIQDFSQPGNLINGVDGSPDWFGSSVDAILRIKCANRVGTPTVNTINNLDADDYSVNIDLSASSPTWNDIKNIFVSIACGGSASVDIKEVWMRVRSRIDNIQQALKYKREFAVQRANPLPMKPRTKQTISKSTISGKVLGRMYGISFGNWIVGRAGSTYGPDTAITNAVYFLEYLLREQLDIAPALIDTTQNDVLGHISTGTRKDWNIAGEVLDKRNSFEILDAIAFEHWIKIVLDPDTSSRKERYKPIALDDGNSRYTVTSADIAFENGKPQITIDKTPLENVYNEFVLNYKMNYATMDTSKTRYLSDDNGDGLTTTNMTTDSGAPRTGFYTKWCDESANRYKMRKRFSYTCEWIRDDATADLLMKKLAEWWAFRRLIVRMSVKKNAETLIWQLGDIVKVTSPLLNTLHSATTKFIITRLNYPGIGKTIPPYIIVECEEIPNVNTGLTQFTKLATFAGPYV